MVINCYGRGASNGSSHGGGTDSRHGVFRGSCSHLWRWIGGVTSSLFSSGNHQSDDELMDIVRRDPLVALRFIRTVMIFNGTGSVVVCIVCMAFLSIAWTQCGNCERPFRWWLLIYALLQMVQVPVRFVFLAKVRDTELTENSLEACVACFTSSPAWNASKNVSLFTYGWFVLGVTWVFNAGRCSACPSMLGMTLAVIAQAIARAIVALVWLRLLILQLDQDDSAEKSKMEAADPNKILGLPRVRFTAGLFADDGANCAVCLCEYEYGESLRQLPCGHYFHRGCADKWLGRSKRCPLCMTSIDVVRDAPPWKAGKYE